MTALITLMLAAGILSLGNGMQSTLITLRGSMEGMSPTLIGVMGTTYFAGYLVGALMAPRLIAQVGHIRVFSALAALCSCGALLMVLYINPYAWMASRFVMGFAFSALFTVIESWVNGVVSNANRGKAYSVYSLVDISTVTAAQFLLPAIGPGGFDAFLLLGMLLAFSLVPIALSPATQPEPGETVSLNLLDTLRISPLAFAACLSIGLTNSAFRTIGPLYAQDVGLNLGQLALFMGAGIGGGAFLQIPFGWLSDRYDRRYVLLMATLGASMASLAISLLPAVSPTQLYAAAFLFGAFSMPLYSLAAAHAADFAKSGEYAALTAGLLFTFALGSMIGPLVAAAAVEAFGPPALFRYICVVHALLVLWALIRMGARPTLPAGVRVRHGPSLRSNPSMARKSLAEQQKP